MDGPEAPAYEATEVTVMLLPLTLKLLWKLADMVIGLPMAPLALQVGVAPLNTSPVLDSRTWLRGCPGLVTDGIMALRLSLLHLEHRGLMQLGLEVLFYSPPVPVQVLINVIRLLEWLARCRQLSAIPLTGKTL